jgi:hypothetical protein
MTTQPSPPITSIGTLNDALHFTDDDLDANRAGQLSDAQRARLRAAFQRSLIVAFIALMGIGLTAAVLIYQGQRSDSLVLSIIGVSLTLVNAAIMGILAQSYIRLSADLRADSLLVTRGIVSHTVRIYSRAASYLLEIQGERLLVPKAVFFAFEDKQSYALYRTRASKTLLSAERL